MKKRQFEQENAPTDSKTWHKIVNALPVSGYKFWTLVVLDRFEESQIINDCLHINISAFEIDTEEHLYSLPFNGIVKKILEVTNACPYLEDGGAKSRGRFSSREIYAATLWLRLRALVPKDCKIRESSNDKTARLLEGDLWVRVGSVEGSAIFSWFQDPERTEAAAKTAMEHAYRADGVDDLPKQRWWPQLDPVENIIRLHTNAGWYAKPIEASSTFREWATMYSRGLFNGNLFSGQMGGFLRALPYLNGNLPVGKFSDIETIAAMSQRRVAIVSPLAHVIEAQFLNGNIEKIWSGLGFSAPASITAIEAPMTIFPYRPMKSWAASFRKTLELVLREAQTSDTEVFLASCGCYGIPLCTRVNEELGILSVYPGHVAHSLFGIYSNAFKDSPIFKFANSRENWVNSDLERRFPVISKIDKNRYGA
ncbi:MAG: hypothetical protein GVY36_17280 [Verrucomicrobia bacterium]|jgi:hypothetical protein|nr:hypothetical protein [Verrucomicrobiota bacterium]